MQTDTAKKIVGFIKSKRQATAKELENYLGISRQALFRQLAKLLEKGEIYKSGKPPKVFYFFQNKKDNETKLPALGKTITEKINQNYLIITPSGEKKEGLDGFAYWCEKNNLPLEKTASEYVRTLQKYDAFRKNGIISGMQKIKNTFSEVYLDSLFYLDFYSIERFGKTRLGQMLLYAKQSQNKKLTQEIISEIKSKVDLIISKYNIDGIGFVPPTVKRETQFMKELERNLRPEIKRIAISKIKTEIAVPQKTLSKLEDRIENANSTFVVEEKQTFKNILLVDDAVGSGATFNEISAKIKRSGISRGKIIGLAITGSFKGFDVISEI